MRGVREERSGRARAPPSARGGDIPPTQVQTRAARDPRADRARVRRAGQRRGDRHDARRSRRGAPAAAARAVPGGGHPADGRGDQDRRCREVPGQGHRA